MTFSLPIAHCQLSIASCSLLRIEDHWRPSLSDYDHLCILRECHFFISLDLFVLQLFVGKTFTDDALVVGDPLCFYSFSICFLFFFL